MKTILVLVIVALAAKYSSSAKVFSCEQGCHDDNECPSNSRCVAVNENAECGMCLCKAGYKTDGHDCVPNKSQKNQKSSKEGNGSKETTSAAAPTTTAGGNGAQTTTSGGGSSGEQTTTAGAQTSGAAATTSAAAVSTTPAGPTTQGPPPAAGPITCSEYNCAPQLPSSNDDNPFNVRSSVVNETAGCKNKLSNPGRSCKMNGGGTCYGVYCLTVEAGNEYCICDYNRVDRQCAVEKPGKCDSATSQVPQSAFKAQNKRFRNKGNPDHGSIYARHFAASFDDCVKLCTWTAGSCRSVNYGSIAGQQVCELLSVSAAKNTILETWLVDAQGWQYAQVVQ